MNTVPQSADEMQRQRGRVRPRWIGDGAKSAMPLTNVPQVTRPQLPLRPTRNLVEAPYWGFDMTGLNTYIIPQHEEKQLALYSKYILRDPKAKPYSDLVSRSIKNIKDREKGRQHDPYSGTRLKQAHRNRVNGTTTMNPTSTTNGTPTYWGDDRNRRGGGGEPEDEQPPPSGPSGGGPGGSGGGGGGPPTPSSASSSRNYYTPLSGRRQGRRIPAATPPRSRVLQAAGAGGGGTMPRTTATSMDAPVIPDTPTPAGTSATSRRGAARRSSNAGYYGPAPTGPSDRVLRPRGGGENSALPIVTPPPNLDTPEAPNAVEEQVVRHDRQLRMDGVSTTKRQTWPQSNNELANMEENLRQNKMSTHQQRLSILRAQHQMRKADFAAERLRSETPKKSNIESKVDRIHQQMLREREQLEREEFDRPFNEVVDRTKRIIDNELSVITPSQQRIQQVATPGAPLASKSDLVLNGTRLPTIPRVSGSLKWAGKSTYEDQRSPRRTRSMTVIHTPTPSSSSYTNQPSQAPPKGTTPNLWTPVPGLVSSKKTLSGSASTPNLKKSTTKKKTTKKTKIQPPWRN